MASTVNTTQAQASHTHNAQHTHSPPSPHTPPDTTAAADHHDPVHGNPDLRKRPRGEYTAAGTDPTNLSTIPPELVHLTLLNLVPTPSAHDTQTLSIDPRPHPSPAAELRRTLAALSKVNRVFHEQVKPLLWRDVRVEHGRGWMGVVDGLVPLSQYSEHHGHLHPLGQAQAADAPLDLPADAPLAASPCIPASPLPMLLEEEALAAPLRPNELTFSTAVAPVPEPEACGNCGIDMPVPLGFGTDASGSTNATGLGLGLLPGGPAVERPAGTCNSCTNSPPAHVRPFEPLVAGSAAGSAPLQSAATPAPRQPDTPHSTPTIDPPAAAAAAARAITIPQRINPYLPSLLTPPSSRRSSPGRWSRSRSRTRQSARSPSPAKSGTRPPSGLRRSLSPSAVVGPGVSGRRMSGSRVRSTSPVDGVALPPLPVVEGGKAPVRQASIRRGRGTDVGAFGGGGSEAGIMQRLGGGEDYFNYHDGGGALGGPVETLQVQELRRALDGQGVDEVGAEVGAVLQPDVDQEKVEGEWFDGVVEEEPPARPPIPQVRTLSFASFRTTGTLRTQEEAVRGKFVTPTRLLNVLRQVPRLKSLAMTEYVDSSLVKSVIEELFFRGYPKPAAAPRRTASMNDAGDMLDEHFLFEQEEWKRRETFECIEAIDFTGCVSRVFSESVQAFVDDWLTEPHGERHDEPERGRSRDVRDITVAHELAHDSPVATPWTKPMFTGMKRLSLRGCVTLSSDTIARLISCCPNLTHLDLSFTRVAPSTLEALAGTTARLEALSLARSTRLTGESIRDFLIDVPAAATIVDLNLFGDATYTSPLNALDIEAIMTAAPCFRNRQLRYLDLSSAPVTSDMLELVTAQPRLRSLGLSFIPLLSLDAVARFLREKAQNVEILTLTSSSTRVDLPPTLSALQTTMTLHQKLINPLTLPPFSILPRPDAKIASRLRILELSEMVRKALGPTGGSRDWKVVKSKGGRGWYVDVSAGWLSRSDTADTRAFRPLVGCPAEDGSSAADELVFTRGLAQDHPWRVYLSSLADAAGKVGSAVGWHSRKMEVVFGRGMLGREEGLYGAGAFAFEG